MATFGFLKNKKTPPKTSVTDKRVPSVPDAVQIYLVRPILSEKATRIKEADNAYIFQITDRANKITVAHEVVVVQSSCYESGNSPGSSEAEKDRTLFGISIRLSQGHCSC